MIMILLGIDNYWDSLWNKLRIPNVSGNYAQIEIWPFVYHHTFKFPCQKLVVLYTTIFTSHPFASVINAY